MSVSLSVLPYFSDFKKLTLIFFFYCTLKNYVLKQIKFPLYILNDKTSLFEKRMKKKKVFLKEAKHLSTFYLI